MSCAFAVRNGTRAWAAPAQRSSLPFSGAERIRLRSAIISLYRGTSARAARSEITETARDLSGLMKTLQEDSPNLFTDQGMDLSIYASDVDFRDPITNYDDVKGFNKNLEFLKSAFNPTYEMLDIRQISGEEVEARWSMGFDVLPIKNSPLGKFWQPRMEFTGTTIYGIDPGTGLVNRHYDTWDSICNQQYFSVEGFKDVLAQIFNFQRTPDIPSPEFRTLKRVSAVYEVLHENGITPPRLHSSLGCISVLFLLVGKVLSEDIDIVAVLCRRKKAYSVRQYSQFIVAAAPIGVSSGSSERTAAFRGLAAYLFGGNQTETKMQMTTPVFSSTDSMQFVLPVESITDAPSPQADSEVQLQQGGGQLYAVLRFSGKVDDDVRLQRRDELLAAITADGLTPEKDSAGNIKFISAQYNDPRVKPLFRRNEMLVPIASGFDLWET